MATELLDSYRMKIPEKLIDKYIERPRYESMFIGNIPMEAQDDIFQYVLFRSVFLLTGKKGCGKRTLEKAFYKEYGEITDEVFEFPFEKFAAQGEDEIIEKLREFLEMLFNAFDEGEMYIASLGVIDAVDDYPDLCNVLADELERIVRDSQSLCMITAVYDGELRNLPYRLRRIFNVCRVEPPSEKERTEFFEGELAPLLSYVTNAAGIDFMVQYTEGFTFDDLKDLIRNMHYFLKSKYVTDSAEKMNKDVSDVEMMDIIMNGVKIEEDDFKYLADNFKPEAPVSMGMGGIDMSALTEALSNISAGSSSEREAAKPEPVSPYALPSSDEVYRLLH